MILGSKPPELDTTYEPPQPVDEDAVEAEVIGLSSVRLTARPVEVTLRQDGTNMMPSSTEKQSETTRGPSLSQAFGEGSARAKQASFLERLQSIKTARGETDRVPLNPPSWKPPPAAEKRGNETTRTKRGKGGRRRGSGRARGGLFRDYLPRAGDEVGADIRAAFEGVSRGGIVASREEIPAEEADAVEREGEEEDDEDDDGDRVSDEENDDDDDDEDDDIEEHVREGSQDVEMQDT